MQQSVNYTEAVKTLLAYDLDWQTLTEQNALVAKINADTAGPERLFNAFRDYIDELRTQLAKAPNFSPLRLHCVNEMGQHLGRYSDTVPKAAEPSKQAIALEINHAFELALNKEHRLAQILAVSEPGCLRKFFCCGRSSLRSQIKKLRDQQSAEPNEYTSLTMYK